MTELLGSGVLIVVTNPVDALCTLLVQRHGLDRRRVLGYTLNDTLRLRTAYGLETFHPEQEIRNAVHEAAPRVLPG